MTYLKRVLVTMSDECGAVLKGYAALWGMTLSEVLYEATRRLIHQQVHNGCKPTAALLQHQGIKLDNRAHKTCWGGCCCICKYDTACRVGIYEGTWECSERYKHLLIEDKESE